MFSPLPLEILPCGGFHCEVQQSIQRFARTCEEASSLTERAELTTQRASTASPSTASSLVTRRAALPRDHRNQFLSVIKKRVLTNRPAQGPGGSSREAAAALRLELSQLRSHSSIRYANTEPLRCIPDTNIMLSDHCTLILKKTKAQSHS